MYNKEIEVRGENNGYVYFIDYIHPLATGNSGRVYLHRHIASMEQGKWLASEEHVHHIDGNKLNNIPNNLKILSNSEHARLHSGEKTVVKCLTCGIDTTNPKYCSVKCSNQGQRTKLDHLSKEDLELLIWSNSYSFLGRELGVSDNTVRNTAKRLGCKMPPSQFHNRSEQNKQLIREQAGIV